MPEYADFTAHPFKDKLIEIFVKKELTVFIRRIECLCQFRRKKRLCIFIEELRFSKVKQRQISSTFRKAG